MNEKIRIKETILCEGKYDKIKLESIVDANILTTNGFSVFNSKEKCLLFKRIAEKNGIIILTDSDGAGFVIRNKLKGILPKEKVINIYIPKITGKEKRKPSPSKENILGVEGMGAEFLRELFRSYGVEILNNEQKVIQKPLLTKAKFYELGYSGRPDSKIKRETLCKKHFLPKSMSANALLEAINLLNIVVTSDDDIVTSKQK